MPRRRTVSGLTAVAAVTPAIGAAAKITCFTLSLAADAPDRVVDRGIKALDDHLKLVRGGNIRRRQQNMITIAAIDRAPRRVASQATRQCGVLYSQMQPRVGIEGSLGGAIGDELNGLKQAAAA